MLVLPSVQGMALAGMSIAVYIKDISGSGMRVWLPNPLPCGMKVEVCSGSTISRGEICRCEQNADGSAMAGIKIFRSAPVGTQLEQLNDSLREVTPVYERLRATD